MGLKFVHKRFPKREAVEEKPAVVVPAPVVKEKKVEEKPKNKKAKKSNNMITLEQIEAAETAVEAIAPETVKRVKKDRGLIERTESSKIILTEDNRQVLND